MALAGIYEGDSVLADAGLARAFRERACDKGDAVSCRLAAERKDSMGSLPFFRRGCFLGNRRAAIGSGARCPSRYKGD